jgi:hypothetical protein
LRAHDQPGFPTPKPVLYPDWREALRDEFRVLPVRSSLLRLYL